MFNKIILLGAMFMLGQMTYAKIITKKIDYSLGEKKFEGFLAYDDNTKVLRPGVVIFHNWMGITTETESKAIEFAKLGSVVFAGDIYGKGIRPNNPKDAGELAGKFKNDRKLLREHAELALAELKKQKFVDEKKILAAGYCFGGTAALELGRTGADLKGLFSFHGGLSNPSPQDAKNFKGKVFIFHGGIDPFVKKEEVDQFLKEMNEASANYQFTAFSNAVHSFTEKAAGNDNSKGAAYNEVADHDSFIMAKNYIFSIK